MQRAFTLLELAVVLVVIGLMSGFALQLMGGDDSSCERTTEMQLRDIEAAMQNFVAAQQRLPRPADMTLGSNATDHGKESAGSGTTAVGGILIGALPHVALGLNNTYASDCWGQKFTYAVTTALTSNDPVTGYPGNALGAITVKSDAATVLAPAIGYVVLSHGPDKFGATPLRAGDAAALNCDGSTAPKLDVENCNSDATFMKAVINTGDTASYFDDVVLFMAKLQSTEPCPAQPVNWLTDCSATSPVVLHGATAAVANTASGFTGNVTVACNDGTLSQEAIPAPTCTPTAPGTCAAGWSDTYVFSHEGDMGACTAYTLTVGNCTSGTGGTTASDQGNTSDCIDHITGAGVCTVHGRICGCLAEGVDHTTQGVDGSNPTLCCSGGDPDANGLCGTQAPPCDNDASDGLTGGQKYCPGVVMNTAGGDLVCFNGIWGASYPFTCNGTDCQSGSATSSITTVTSGCTPPPDCANGDTFPVMDCSETSQCTCN